MSPERWHQHNGINVQGLVPPQIFSKSIDLSFHHYHSHYPRYDTEVVFVTSQCCFYDIRFCYLNTAVWPSLLDYCSSDL